VCVTMSMVECLCVSLCVCVCVCLCVCLSVCVCVWFLPSVIMRCSLQGMWHYELLRRYLSSKWLLVVGASLAVAPPLQLTYDSRSQSRSFHQRHPRGVMSLNTKVLLVHTHTQTHTHS